MVFIRYPTHSKGYVIYEKHPNGSITEIDSRNVDFLENVFLSIGEIRKDLELYELQQDLQASFGKGEDLNSRQATEDCKPPLLEMHEGNLSAQRNEVHPYSPTLEENQPKNEVCP